MMGPSQEVAEVLRGLEEELLRPDVRRDLGRLEQMLAEEFREFGTSGREYEDREAIVAALAVEGAAERRVTQFRVEMLGGESALVTYRCHCESGNGAAVESLRSSVWVWRDGRWQMVFHQGTRAEVGA